MTQDASTLSRSRRPVTGVAAIGVLVGVLMIAWPVRVTVPSLDGPAVIDCGSAVRATFHRPRQDVEELAPGIDESAAWFHCGPHASKWLFAGSVIIVASAAGWAVARKRRERFEEAYRD